jgi:hypothetical protein
MRKPDALKTYVPKVYARKSHTILALVAALLLIPAAASHADLFGSKKPKLPAGMPRKWDKTIPIPPGAVVANVKAPSPEKSPLGIVHTVNFIVPGDFDGLIEFYSTELPKAGFELGPQVKVPARKAYDLNFSKASVQNTLTIAPDAKDPAKFDLRIIYELPNRHRHLLKLLADRWKMWPKFWRSEKPPVQPTPAPDTSGSNAPSGAATN